MANGSARRMTSASRKGRSSRSPVEGGERTTATLLEREQQTKVVPWALGILLVSMIAGGGSTRGGAVEAVLVVLGIAMIATLSLLHWTGLRRVGRGTMTLVALYGGLALLALFQILPVAGPWTISTLHLLAQEIRQVAGWQGPHPTLSLDPDATRRFAASLSIPAAVAFAVAGAGMQERRRILFAIALVAGASTLLAVLQWALDGQAWLLPYEPFGRAKGGLMNNVNHQGLLASLGLLAAAGHYAMRKREPLVRMKLRERKGYRRNRAIPRIWWVVGVAVWTVVGVAVSLSMAALLLGALTLVGLPFILRFERAPGKAPLAIAGVLVALLAVAAVVLFAEPLTDPGERSVTARFAVYPALFDLLRESFPWGIGLGAFVASYRTQERLETLMSSYLNHAHNEPLQFLIETGLPGLLVLGIVGVLLARTTRRRWHERSLPKRRMMLTALFALFLVALHSMVDFPLRTTSIASACAAFLALVVTQAPRPADAIRVAPVRLLAGVPMAALVALLALPSYQSWTAQHLASSGLSERALTSDPAHPQALAGRAWRSVQDRPADARADARAAIAGAPLQSSALRTLLVLDGEADRIDREGWSLAGQLGWHDPVTQTVLAVDDLQRGDNAAASQHIIALLSRGGMTPELSALVRPQLLNEDFRRSLVGSLEGRGALLNPLVQVDAQTSGEELDAIAALSVQLLEDGHSISTQRLVSLLNRLVLAGHREQAVAVEQARIAAGPVGQGYGPSTRSPFDFAPGNRGNARIRVTQGNERLIIVGDGGASASLVGRYLPVAPGPVRIEAQLEVPRGDPRVALQLECPGSGQAEVTFADRAGTIRLETEARCYAPLLTVRIVDADAPYRIELIDWNTM
ncbi:O-antigen ligase family protein [Sphingomicrobium sp. XHP0239]|uniref:O-antigen ligase family protein n=1 Tax=Sphingomicrobium maritimum TaxID=3133972 RepID=UPI0031CCC1E3